MANKSSIETNSRRKRMVERKKETRSRLKALIMDKNTSIEDRMKAVYKLSEMPRNSSYIRIRNRCALTGRPRGYYRKFGISRIALRDLGSAGLLPGVTKASW